MYLNESLSVSPFTCFVLENLSHVAAVGDVVGRLREGFLVFCLKATHDPV